MTLPNFLQLSAKKLSDTSNRTSGPRSKNVFNLKTLPNTRALLGNLSGASHTLFLETNRSPLDNVFNLKTFHHTSSDPSHCNPSLHLNFFCNSHKINLHISFFIPTFTSSNKKHYETKNDT